MKETIVCPNKPCNCAISNLFLYQYQLQGWGTNLCNELNKLLGDNDVNMPVTWKYWYPISVFIFKVVKRIYAWGSF